MNVGDIIKATWSDGLVLFGTYVGVERGWVILLKDDKKIVCDANTVKFEVVSESG